MAKTYRTPTVASLGAAETLTKGLLKGKFTEVGTFIKTTHAVLDL
jgi:hypothetical protein